MSEQQTIRPDFFEEAAAVMNSVYWRTPQIADARKQVAATMALDAEREKLSKALRTCSCLTDLRGEARAIYERALATLSAG